MVDQLGDATERPVVEAVYSGDTIDRINFENLRFDNAYVIAQTTGIHPSSADRPLPSDGSGREPRGNT